MLNSGCYFGQHESHPLPEGHLLHPPIEGAGHVGVLPAVADVQVLLEERKMLLPGVHGLGLV